MDDNEVTIMNASDGSTHSVCQASKVGNKPAPGGSGVRILTYWADGERFEGYDNRPAVWNDTGTRYFTR